MKFLVTLDRDEKAGVSLETRRAEGLPLALDVVEVEVQTPTK